MVKDAHRKWMLSELFGAAGVDGRFPRAGFDPIIDRLSTDSRDVRPGTCFVALVGTRVDGHAFVEQAVAAGASAIVVSAPHTIGDCPIAVRVPDTRDALARLAATFFGIRHAQGNGHFDIIGVTGTNGKTTVCALLRSILESSGRRTMSLGTIAGEIGATSRPSRMTTLPPIDLCAQLAEGLAGGATHAVMEVSSHALDQRRCAGLDFRVAVFTNLTQDHLDYHGDFASYGRAKRRIFEQLRPGASAVIGADDRASEMMAAAAPGRVLRFGLRSSELEFGATNLELAIDGSRFDLCLRGETIPIRSPLIGRHNVLNMLAAAAAAHALDVAPHTIRKGIESVTQVRGRLERVASAQQFQVFVDYAHTPDALQNVLELLGAVAPGRLICVFGCGGDRDRSKRPLMGRVVATLADVAVVTSDNPRSEDAHAIIEQTIAGCGSIGDCRTIVEADRRKAIEMAVRIARPGDVVLIAGKGHETYQIVGSEQLPFDDVIVASEAVQCCSEVVW